VAHARQALRGAQLVGGEAPALAAVPPTSYHTMCAVSSHTTSSPGRPSTVSATWLHIVPEGMNTAASLPSSAATRSHRALTVGSSNAASSPQSAFAIACRMAGVGRVLVSDPKSMKGRWRMGAPLADAQA